MSLFQIDKINKQFPLESYRLGQREAIERIMQSFNDGYKFVFLEAPTGSGKSAIGYTLAQSAQKSFYLAPQKFLQDQLSYDFGVQGKHVSTRSGNAPMVELKGRNAYPCEYWDWQLEDLDIVLTEDDRKRFLDKSRKKLGCDQGQCKKDNKSNLDYCMIPSVRCKYFKQLNAAKASKICLMNFHSFLFQSAVTNQFGHRDLMILDESHNTEDILLKFIELKISDRYFVKDEIKFPKFDSVKRYIEYFENIDLISVMQRKSNIALANDDIKEADEWKSRIGKLKYLLTTDPDRWVCTWEEVSSRASRTVTIKPIYVDDFAYRYLFNMADNILFMSATILSFKTMCKALGIPLNDAKSLVLPSIFPSKYRRIHYRPCGSMSYKNKHDTFPKMIEEVDHLCRHHANQRGIIHTHTFEIAEKLLNNCSKDVQKRFLFQRHIQFDGDKNLLLQQHKKSKNSIIIAPAMHEGLDLKDDLGRFQIICKVPYPSKGDPQIAAKMEISPDYYNWRTATKLVQSYGRIYRYAGDHGVTYVLDDNFRYFVKSNPDLLPKWFREAIVWDD